MIYPPQFIENIEELIRLPKLPVQLIETGWDAGWGADEFLLLVTDRGYCTRYRGVIVRSRISPASPLTHLRAALVWIRDQT